MSGVKRIQKDDIINAALDIIRESGIENVQARTIAKKLNCSTQPIFYQFSNMDEIKMQLQNKILEIFRGYFRIDENGKLPYKEVGKNYIKFAKDEPKLFQLICMNNSNLKPKEYMMYDNEIYNIIHKFAGISTGLDNEKVDNFHLQMLIFAHGIATLIASKTCDFTEKEISKMLSLQYKAQLLLQYEEGNVTENEIIERRKKNWNLEE